MSVNRGDYSQVNFNIISVACFDIDSVYLKAPTNLVYHWNNNATIWHEQVLCSVTSMGVSEIRWWRWHGLLRKCSHCNVISLCWMMGAHTRTHAHTHTYAYTHAHIHTHTQTHSLTYSHARPHTPTHPCLKPYDVQYFVFMDVIYETAFVLAIKQLSWLGIT